MKSKLLAAAAFVALSYSPAFAATDAEEYQRLLDRASISLTQAIANAEAHASGTAVSSELDSHRGEAVFEVSVLSSGKIFDVDVNAVDGSIIRSVEDRD